MKKALIFGISGQDGAYLSRLLIGKDYDVTGTSRDAQVSSFSNLVKLGIREKITLKSASVTDFRSVLQVLDEVQPDEVYNLAGQSSVGLSFGLPVETFDSVSVGTLTLLEAIRFSGQKLRFYNACSGECFGDTKGLPATELTPFSPRSPYGVAKAASYWLVANYRDAYALHASSGILFNHESPLRPERFVTRKIVNTAVRIARGSDERLVLGSTSMSRDWGWAPEYVEAMWRMLQLPEPQDFIIATGRSRPLSDFVSRAFEAVELDWQAHVDFEPGFVRPSEIPFGAGDASKAKEVLGWVAETHMDGVVDQMVRAEMECLRGENRI